MKGSDLDPFYMILKMMCKWIANKKEMYRKMDKNGSEKKIIGEILMPGCRIIINVCFLSTLQPFTIGYFHFCK